MGDELSRPRVIVDDPDCMASWSLWCSELQERMTELYQAGVCFTADWMIESAPTSRRMFSIKTDILEPTRIRPPDHVAMILAWAEITNLPGALDATRNWVNFHRQCGRHIDRPHMRCETMAYLLVELFQRPSISDFAAELKAEFQLGDR